MSDTKTIVNSWNEWDPLKHVIVGRADGTCIPAPEPALDAKVPEDSDMRGQFGPRTKDTVDKAHKTLTLFVLIGWAIYPLGYMLGTADGQWYSFITAINLDMDVVYNIGDAINKIGFGLVVYAAAVASKK